MSYNKTKRKTHHLYIHVHIFMKKSEFEHEINKLNEQTIINRNFSFFLL